MSFTTIHSQSRRRESAVQGDAPRLTQAQVGLLALALIVLLGAALRFYKLGTAGVGNAYYAATVRSMLAGPPANFFFAAYEPGGSVTVDKPPLGFWLQALSAALLGVNGFALALPQALAGTLSIPVLYSLVRRPFGRWAALIAALALAVTSVAVATERNNTVDGVLVLILLLAAWAFWRAAESGRLRPLLLGAVLVGLGFNVKMLQALMPLPAFYGLYLLGARLPWKKRAAHLALATIVLLAVSLSWALAVDLTPAEARPYVGSSETNSVLELIVGHNGLRRLNLFSSLSSNAPQIARQAGPRAGAPSRPPATGSGPPQGPPPAGGGPGGAPGDEVGQPGWLRLVRDPLVGEAGWLLPTALIGLPLALAALGRPRTVGRPWALRRCDRRRSLALVLWGGWLLPALLYFSLNAGLWHAYYLIMVGPPLAALMGVAAWALWRLAGRHLGVALGAFAALAAGTLWVQISALGDYARGVLVLALLLLAGGLALLAWAARRQRRALARAGLSLALLALLVAPALWSGLTALNEHPHPALPRAGPEHAEAGPGDGTLTPAQEALLDYLLAHTGPDAYLVAALSSHEVSGYILATGRPALVLGGFNGADPVVSVDELAGRVAAGDLRYVIGGPELSRGKPEIGRWVEENCAIVEDWDVSSAAGERPLPMLYDCGERSHRAGGDS